MGKVEKLQPFFETSLKSLRGLESGETVINVSFVPSKKGLPARFLAGFIPAFALADALSKERQTPTLVRVFVPLNLSTFCNEVDGEHAQQLVTQGRSLLEEFTEKFHPEVRWGIDIDKPWSDEATNLLQSFWQVLRKRGDRNIDELMGKLEESAKRNGNGEAVQRAHLYATHHVFGWQDFQSPLFFEGTGNPIQVINCMSSSERAVFQPLRRSLMEEVTTSQPNIVLAGQHLDLFTTRCPGPHYIRSGQGDLLEPTLDELLSKGFDQTLAQYFELEKVNPKFSTARKDLEMTKIFLVPSDNPLPAD